MTERSILIAVVMTLCSPALAQLDPNAATMSCADYIKASKNAPNSVLGNVKTGDAEADASMADMDRQILKICAKSPKITIREAMQKAIMEMD
jgi:hypothetical protein